MADEGRRVTYKETGESGEKDDKMDAWTVE